MRVIDNYKYMFFKEVYNNINLKSVEQKMLGDNIKPLEVIKDDKYDIISNYFFLLNVFNIEALSKEQLQDFYTYFSKDINSLNEQELQKAREFINETYSTVLFPKTDSKCVYYGPINDDYLCPRDAIVIGLYYDAFGEYGDFELENKLADIINYIQFSLDKKNYSKIAVIPFNQITLENRISSLNK